MSRTPFGICVVWVLLLQGRAVAAPPVGVDHPQNVVVHMLGATFDTGWGKDRAGATSLGARFIRLNSFPSRRNPIASWLGYGADLRVITLGLGSLDAGLGQIVVLGGFGTEAGVGGQIELAIGGATGRSTLPHYAAGAFFAPVPLFAFGFTSQEPISASRPTWLEQTQFGVRFVLPIDHCGSVFANCAANRPEPAPSR